MKYDMGADKSSATFGFWLKTGVLTDTWASAIFVSIQDSGSSPLLEMTIGNAGSSNSVTIYGTDVSSELAISDATWYWFNIKFVQNGTSSLRIYNESGNVVGSGAVTCPTFDGAARKIAIGCLSAIAGSSGTSYFDDLVIDYTDATFPLGK
jgi:hypothetical protein